MPISVKNNDKYRRINVFANHPFLLVSRKLKNESREKRTKVVAGRVPIDVTNQETEFAGTLAVIKNTAAIEEIILFLNSLLASINTKKELKICSKKLKLAIGKVSNGNLPKKKSPKSLARGLLCAKMASMGERPQKTCFPPSTSIRPKLNHSSCW